MSKATKFPKQIHVAVENAGRASEEYLAVCDDALGLEDGTIVAIYELKQVTRLEVERRLAPVKAKP